VSCSGRTEQPNEAEGSGSSPATAALLGESAARPITKKLANQFRFQARFTIGLLGRSNSKTTRRDPHAGHFNRPSNIEIGKAPPLVQTRVSRSSRMLALHSRIVFIPSRRPQAQRAVIFTPLARASARVSIMREHYVNASRVVNDGRVAGESISSMPTQTRIGLSVLAIIIALCVMANFRRPYVVETIALELYCPDHKDTGECLLYNRLGLVYTGPKQQAAPVCQNSAWHFVGYNSNGTAQCCGPGFHWNGRDTNKCTQD
jgi:hypothetical protein